MSSLQNIFRNLLEFFSLIIPNSKKEWLVLFIPLVFYYSLGVYLSLNTIIIDSFNYVDLYFSFDNGNNIYLGAFEDITHPLLTSFYKPIRYIYDLTLIWGLDSKVFTLFVVFLCAFFVSYSILFVFKYLHNIIKLELKYCYALCILYGLFSGNIILSFTADSFTFSLFLLSLCIYISSYYLSKERVMSIFYYIFMGIIVGGQTLTNVVKTGIPMLFEKKFTLKNMGALVLKALIAYSIVAVVLLIPFNFDIAYVLEENIERGARFKIDHGSTFQAVNYMLQISFMSFFFGGNIFFLQANIEHNFWFWILHKGIFPYPLHYSSIQFILSFIILLLMIKSFFLNRKNKLFWILALFLGVDLFILFALRVSANESFIFGGHYIFVIPLALGWLFQKLTLKRQKILFYSLIVLGVCIAVNNGFRLLQFIELAQSLLPNKL